MKSQTVVTEKKSRRCDTVAVNKFFQGLKAKKDDKAKWKTADIHKSCHKDQSYVKLGHKNTPTTNICEDAF